MAGGYSCDAKVILSSNVLFGPVDGAGPNNGGVIFGVTVLPHILRDANFGFQSGEFGFDYNGVSNQTAIIEVNTNLSQSVWVPLQTNLLTGSPLYFSDPGTAQNPTAFYRIRSP
jgi:hypothetical protein